MTTTAVLGAVFALASALLWALVPILYRRLGDHLSPQGINLGKTILAVIGFGLVTAATGTLHVPLRALGLLVASGILGITLGDTCFLMALVRLGPRVAVLTTVLIPAVVVLLAALVLGERLSPRQIAGVLVTLGGTGWVLWQRDGGPPAERRQRAAGVLYALLSVVVCALAVICSKLALVDVSAAQGSFVRQLGALAALLVWAVGAGRLRAWLGPLRDVSLMARLGGAVFLGTFVGVWLSMAALKQTSASVATVLNATSPLFVLPLAALLRVREERGGSRALLGAIVAVIGVVLILYPPSSPPAPSRDEVLPGHWTPGEEPGRLDTEAGAASRPAPNAWTPPPNHVALTPAKIRLEGDRVATSQPEHVMQELGVRPGVRILDIGAGSGAWAYAFARRMAGQGSILATDVDPDMVRFMEEEVRRQGLPLVRPVLLRPEHDPFYASQSVDIVFLAHVWYWIKDHAWLAEALRKSLRPGGRVGLLGYRPFGSIRPEHLTDLPGLVRALRREPPEGPVRRRLSPSTLALLEAASPEAPRGELAEALAGDLTAMLKDPEFHLDFWSPEAGFRPSVHLLPEERAFVEPLLRRWYLGDPAAAKSGPPREWLMNPPLLVQHLRPYLYGGQTNPCLPDGASLAPPTCMDERRVFEQAGFKLAHRAYFIPGEVLCVFEPDAPSSP